MFTDVEVASSLFSILQNIFLLLIMLPLSSSIHSSLFSKGSLNSSSFGMMSSSISIISSSSSSGRSSMNVNASSLYAVLIHLKCWIIPNFLISMYIFPLLSSSTFITSIGIIILFSIIFLQHSARYISSFLHEDERKWWSLGEIGGNNSSS